MQIDILLLIILFITPGLYLSSLIDSKSQFLLTPVFSIFFWSFSSFIISLNYLIKNIYGNYLIYVLFVVWVIKYKNIKNPIFNIFLLLIFENINNAFGFLHIVSTSYISYEAAVANLSFLPASFGIPSIQISFLKFFNDSFILLTLNQFISFSLLFYNLKVLIKSKNLTNIKYLMIVPAFLIFSLFLEIMTIRSHFLASQILCFLLIETFISKKNTKSNNYLFFMMLCLFLSSRLENIVLYFPLVLLILHKYFDDINLMKNFQSLFLLILATISPLAINYHSYVYAQDIRSDISLLVLLVLLLIVSVVFKNQKFIKIIFNNLNFLFSSSLFLLAVILYNIFGVKALNSWIFVSNHLLDTHRGWAVFTLYFLLTLIYLSVATDNFYLKNIYRNVFFTFLLIIISSPLHHSIYGGEDWLTGITEGLAIYNPYDESQTRSVIQLFLSILPFTVLIPLKNNKVFK